MNILQALACNIDRVKDKRSVNWFFMTFQFGRIREWPLFPGKLGEPSTFGFALVLYLPQTVVEDSIYLNFVDKKRGMPCLLACSSVEAEQYILETSLSVQKMAQ
jgi:hypothetical protein